MERDEREGEEDIFLDVRPREVGRGRGGGLKARGIAASAGGGRVCKRKFAWGN